MKNVAYFAINWPRKALNKWTFEKIGSSALLFNHIILFGKYFVYAEKIYSYVVGRIT